MGVGGYQQGVAFNYFDVFVDQEHMAALWHIGVWDFGETEEPDRFKVEIYARTFATTAPRIFWFSTPQRVQEAVLTIVRSAVYYTTPEDTWERISSWWRPVEDWLRRQEEDDALYGREEKPT